MTKKIWILAAVICIFVGCIIVCGSAASVGFDFTKFNTYMQEKKTYTIEESFENIDIQTTEASVILLPSQKDTCEIVCAENDKITHTVSVENNTLKVVRKDTRKWYEYIGVFYSISDFEIKVYLPKSEYTMLRTASVSGDIVVPDTFAFSEADLSTTSGSISFEASIKTALTGKSVSGDMDVKNIAGGTVNLTTTSGEMDLEDTLADSINLRTTSGDISLENTAAAKELFIKSTSGEISLESCDGGDITIKTTSGDVKGSLRSEKQFVTHTTSGDVRVQDSAFAVEKCTVSTTSGDIRFTIE